MAKCLKINVSFEGDRQPFQENIASKAKELSLEGILEVVNENQIEISVCGTTEKIDDFIDFIYEEHLNVSAVVIDIEPFIKEKDFRLVFRIIE